MARRKSEVAVAVMSGMGVPGKDLTDPAMTMENNPMACSGCPIEEAIVDRNFSRLHQDAHMRRNRATGNVYAGIMDMRYGG